MAKAAPWISRHLNFILFNFEGVTDLNYPISKCFKTVEYTICVKYVFKYDHHSSLQEKIYTNCFARGFVIWKFFGSTNQILLTYVFNKIFRGTLVINFPPNTNVPPPTTWPKPRPMPTRPTVEAWSTI